MDKWVGKVALVTGASLGIGKAIVDKLVQSGMKVVACARSEEKLKPPSLEVNKCGQGEMFPIKCNVRNEQEILAMFKFIKEKFGVLHVCVNNAGIFTEAHLLDGKTEDWQEMIEVNMLAPCIVARESYSLMKKHDGHFININSTGGHKVAPNAVVYCATKHAVTALTEGLRQELRAKKNNIRTTSISPGLTATNIFDKTDNTYAKEGIKVVGQCLQPEEVADAVLFALSAPLHMDVNEITIKPTVEVF